MFRSALLNLYTADMAAALGFYQGLLGFTETFRTPVEGIPDHVEMVLGGFVLGLGSTAAARRVHGVEPTPGAPAGALVIWCDDTDEACRLLAGAGVEIVQAPHDTGNDNRNALLRGPDGHLVEVVSKLSPTPPT